VFFSTTTRSKKYKIAKSYNNNFENYALVEKENRHKKYNDILTEHQKAKLEYIFMEEESKIYGLKRNLNTAKKIVICRIRKRKL